MPWIPLFLTLTCVWWANPECVELPQQPQPVDERPPVAVFARFNGSWQGTFVGYGEDGRELYRITVKQTYATVDDETQRVQIIDRMADGTVITGKGTNTARRRADGSLDLRCTVQKSNGDKVEHRGRVVKGADGEEQLIWYSKSANKTESFREVVHAESGKATYSIDGMGRYGDTLVLMHGKYRRVETQNR